MGEIILFAWLKSHSELSATSSDADSTSCTDRTATDKGWVEPAVQDEHQRLQATVGHTQFPVSSRCCWSVFQGWNILCRICSSWITDLYLTMFSPLWFTHLIPDLTFLCEIMMHITFSCHIHLIGNVQEVPFISLVFPFKTHSENISELPACFIVSALRYLFSISW